MALTNDWTKLENGTRLLTATISQAHKRFRSHNEQGGAVGIVACAFAYIQRMDSWKVETLDQILIIGDLLYLKSRQLDRCREKLLPIHIYRYFFLGNIKVSMVVEIDVKLIAIFDDRSIVDNLEGDIAEFLTHHTFGIFYFKGRYFTFWRYYDFYFLFDSTEHDNLGERWKGLPGLGYAALKRFPSLRQLVELIYFSVVPLRHKDRFILYPVRVENMIRVNTKPPETIEKARPVQLLPEKTRPVQLLPEKRKTPKKHKPKSPPVSDIEIGQGDQVEIKTVPPEIKTVPPERPKLQSVTNFKELTPGISGILRGSTHQSDPKFSKYKGTQSLANAFAALCMLRAYKSKHWHRDIVNNILKLGEVIQHDLMTLPLDEFPDDVTVEGKKYHPTFQFYKGGAGCLVSTESSILSLEDALTNLFVDEDCTILCGPNYIIAIWKEQNRYYMFDPNECDENGMLVNEKGGVACVMWFSKLKDLVAKILNKLPGILHKSIFQLAKVNIEDAVEKSEDWFNFKALTLDKWILRGTFSQKDRRFSEESRNAQCTACATVALAYKEFQEEKDWSTETIDNVLIIGDEFYNACVEYLKEKDLFKNSHLMVDEVKRSFDLADKRVILEIDDCLVNGIINAKSDTDVPNLKKGFEQFFTESDAGVVTANDQSMAVWKRDDAYYYYDSHSRDKKGISVPYGTACLMRMLTIEELTKMLMTNLRADPRNLYNISRVGVRITDVTDDGFVKPPLHNYEAVNDYVSILRSNFSHKDPKFDINAGKQTVPMCLAALAMHLLVPASGWKKEDLDQVLTFGDELYTKTMEELEDEVTSDNVLNEMTIGANHFKMELEEYSTGNFEENLKEAFEALDPEMSQSIFESRYLIGSMWKDESTYFFFDPQARDEKGQIYGKDDWSVGVVKDENEEPEPEELVDDDNTGQDEEEENEELVAEELDDDNNPSQDEGEEEEEVVTQFEKKGSDYWRQQEKNGKACVLRFCRLEDLVKHILENSPPNQRQETEYTWKTIKVTNEPVLHEEESNWNNFVEIDRGRWILRSDRAMTDAIYLANNRGKQAIPMCIIALVIASYYSISDYKPETVNAIMQYGDRLHTVLKRLRSGELKQSKEVKLSDEEIEEILKNANFDVVHYPMKICIWEKLTTWAIELGVINGDITSKTPEVYNVASALSKFFEGRVYGLMQCNDYSVAVWHSHDFFYMFDPHKCGPSGRQSPTGVACITRFSNVEDLANLYVSNVPQIGNHFFVIHSFSFSHDKCPIGVQPVLTAPRLPKIGGFNSVMLGKQILRGTLQSTSFSRGVNIYSSAVAIVALAVSLCKDPLTWTKIMIDEIMKSGQDLWTDSVENLGDTFDTWGDILKLDQVNADFTIGTFKINWTMRLKEQRGIVDVKNSKIPNLRQGLESFLQENSRGILLVQRLTLAIWQEQDYGQTYIYIFDPNSRSGTGLPTHGGVACVVRFWNAKLAADHVMACILEEDKTRLEYVIVPIELVIGKTHYEWKKVCDLSTFKKKSREKSKPVTCPKKPTILEQKRVLRRIAAEERRKKEETRVYELGRTSMYKLSNEEWIVRGTRALDEDTDVPVNYIAFFLLQASPDLDAWTSTNVELILQIGRLLYVDSTIAYKHRHKKLGLHDVLRKFVCLDIEIKLKLLRPLTCASFTKRNVIRVLDEAFMLTPCFLLTYDTFVVTLYFKSGFYYLFDPYSRNLEGFVTEEADGSAALMKFADLESLVEKLVFNLSGVPDQQINRFALVFLQFDYVRQLSK